MYENKIILFAALALVVGISIFTFLSFKLTKAQALLRAVKRRHVEELLHVEGTPALDYRRIPELWTEYSSPKGVMRIHFETMASRFFTLQVQGMRTLEEIRSFFASFKRALKSAALKPDVAKMLTTIHSNVCENVFNHFTRLAVDTYKKVLAQGGTEQEFDFMANFGEFFIQDHLNKSLRQLLEKEKEVFIAAQ